jgi:Protein of unknown function (DUF3352)
MLRAASLAALSLLAALLVACGGGGASGEADPASAVPADAMFYGEVAIKPEGDTRDDALAAAGKVLRTDDPSGKIHELLDKALAEENETKLDWDKDIKPWLGDRVGIWFDSQLDINGDPGGSLIVAVTDQDAAVAAVRKGSTNSGDKLTKRSYKGSDYDVDQDGDAFGVVGDDFLAFGPEPQFRRTVDAQKGGQSLSESDRYKKALDKLDDKRLAHFSVDFQKIFELAAKQNGEQQLQQLKSVIPFDKLGPLMGSFQANGDRLALDASLAAQGKAAGLGALGNLYSASSTPLLQDLPGESWGAYGAGKYGQSLRAALDQYAGLFGGAAAREQLKNQFGIDLDEDILSWIGDIAVFVRGDTLQTIDGGLVIQVTDKDKAAKGFGKLVGLVQSTGGVGAKPVSVAGAEAAFAIQDGSTPKPIVVARSAEKVVAAYGVDAAKAALNPQSKLGDSDTWKAAQDALGDDDMQPSMLVAMAPILSLVESSGSTDADYQKAKPYLEAYDVFALGAKSSGGNARVRLAAGLK